MYRKEYGYGVIELMRSNNSKLQFMKRSKVEHIFKNLLQVLEMFPLYNRKFDLTVT